MFNTIKRYYKIGYYSKEQVAVFVAAGWITPEQYTQIIIGEPHAT